MEEINTTKSLKAKKNVPIKTTSIDKREGSGIGTYKKKKKVTQINEGQVNIKVDPLEEQNEH